jgi:hypothetical protein
MSDGKEEFVEKADVTDNDHNSDTRQNSDTVHSENKLYHQSPSGGSTASLPSLVATIGDDKSETAKTEPFSSLSFTECVEEKETMGPEEMSVSESDNDGKNANPATEPEVVTVPVPLPAVNETEKSEGGDCLQVHYSSPEPNHSPGAQPEGPGHASLPPSNTKALPVSLGPEHGHEVLKGDVEEDIDSQLIMTVDCIKDEPRDGTSMDSSDSESETESRSTSKIFYSDHLALPCELESMEKLESFNGGGHNDSTEHTESKPAGVLDKTKGQIIIFSKVKIDDNDNEKVSQTKRDNNTNSFGIDIDKGGGGTKKCVDAGLKTIAVQSLQGSQAQEFDDSGIKITAVRSLAKKKKITIKISPKPFEPEIPTQTHTKMGNNAVLHGLDKIIGPGQSVRLNLNPNQPGGPHMILPSGVKIPVSTKVDPKTGLLHMTPANVLDQSTSSAVNVVRPKPIFSMVSPGNSLCAQPVPVCDSSPGKLLLIPGVMVPGAGVNLSGSSLEPVHLPTCTTTVAVSSAVSIGNVSTNKMTSTGSKVAHASLGNISGAQPIHILVEKRSGPKNNDPVPLQVGKDSEHKIHLSPNGTAALQNPVAAMNTACGNSETTITVPFSSLSWQSFTDHVQPSSFGQKSWRSQCIVCGIHRHDTDKRLRRLNTRTRAETLEESHMEVLTTLFPGLIESKDLDRAYDCWLICSTCSFDIGKMYRYLQKADTTRKIVIQRMETAFPRRDNSFFTSKDLLSSGVNIGKLHEDCHGARFLSPAPVSHVPGIIPSPNIPKYQKEQLEITKSTGTQTRLILCGTDAVVPDSVLMSALMASDELEKSVMLSHQKFSINDTKEVTGYSISVHDEDSDGLKKVDKKSSIQGNKHASIHSGEKPPVKGALPSKEVVFIQVPHAPSINQGVQTYETLGVGDNNILEKGRLGFLTVNRGSEEMEEDSNHAQKSKQENDTRVYIEGQCVVCGAIPYGKQTFQSLHTQHAAITNFLLKYCGTFVLKNQQRSCICHDCKTLLSTYDSGIRHLRDQCIRNAPWYREVPPKSPSKPKKQNRAAYVVSERASDSVSDQKIDLSDEHR